MLVEISIFNYHNPKGTKLLTRLRLAFNHLSDHKFKREFQDTFSLSCSCDNEFESTYNYSIHCPYCFKERIFLLDKITDINEDILTQDGELIARTLIFGDSKLSKFKNMNI